MPRSLLDILASLPESDRSIIQTELETAQNNIKKCKENEEKYKLLIENTSELVVKVDASGKFQFVSRSYCELFGKTEDELLGNEFIPLVHEDDVIPTKEAMKKLFAPPYSCTLKQRAKTKLGWRWIEWNDDAVLDSENNVISIIGVGRDITNEVEIQETLKKRNLFIQTVLDNLPIGVALNDIDKGTAKYMNKKFEEIYGWPEDDLKNISEFFEKVYPDEAYRDSIINQVMRDISSGDPLRMHWENIKIKTKSGQTKIINAQNIPLFKQNTMVSTVIDITNLKKVEEELKNSINRFNLAKKSLKMGVWDYDLKDNVQVWDNTMYELYDVDRSQFDGKLESWFNLIHESDLERVKREVELALEEKNEYDTEYKILKPSGEVRYIRGYATILRDSNGSPSRALGINYDVTETVLSEKAYIESQRLNAIGEMSSAVAHDFNNSLQAILGNIELTLHSKNLTSKDRNYLESIRTAANDAATRVQLLQRFSGKRQRASSYSQVDINSVLKDVIIQSQPVWKNSQEKEGKAISVKTNFGDIPKVDGNDSELRVVVYNIIINCVEAMPEGGEILISSFEKNGYVNVDISDTGLGMDEETKSRIFQPFFSTKGFEVGRGLGLSGAYSIIKEHNGTIKVLNSSKENGTTIQICLPAVKEAVPEKTETIKQPLTKPANILWIDDDPLILDIALELLEVLGHFGEIVSSGEDALNKLRSKEFDLIITDIGMPGMNGWELIDKINSEFGRKTKIAVLTGWGDQINEEKKAEHSVDFILGKPFKLSDLERLLKTVLKE